MISGLVGRARAGGVPKDEAKVTSGGQAMKKLGLIESIKLLLTMPVKVAIIIKFLI